jgi:UDPglucose 6-dehydrogenase
VQDFSAPDRVVIGAHTQRPIATMKELYAPFNAPIIVTDINSAELIKHAANSLALKISYINAISVICEAAGANVQEVASGIGMDSRIGRQFLDASLGFGGSCFPKDLSAFIKIAERLGYDFALLKEVQRINAQQSDRFLKKIIDTLGCLKKSESGCWSRVQTEHRRRPDVAGSIYAIVCRRRRFARPRSRDGESQSSPARRDLCRDMNDVADGCDALVIATEESVQKLDLERARKVMTHPILFDGRNLLIRVRRKSCFIYKISAVEQRLHHRAGLVFARAVYRAAAPEDHLAGL